MNFKKYIFGLEFFSILIAFSCQKKSNIYTEHWIARQAGSYMVKEIKFQKYINETLITDSIVPAGKCTFILKSIEAEGSTCYEMDIYGNYLPQFLNHVSTGFAWATEKDNKRLSLGYLDPSIGYIPSATLTVDKMGAKKQQWNYIQTYFLGAKDVYIRYTYTVERIN